MGVFLVALPDQAVACRNERDQQQGVALERAYLLKRARELVSRGQQAEHVWHTANRAEHVTAMLQVRPSALLSLPGEQDAMFPFQGDSTSEQRSLRWNRSFRETPPQSVI